VGLAPKWPLTNCSTWLYAVGYSLNSDHFFPLQHNCNLDRPYAPLKCIIHIKSSSSIAILRLRHKCWRLILQQSLSYKLMTSVPHRSTHAEEMYVALAFSTHKAYTTNIMQCTAIRALSSDRSPEPTHRRVRRTHKPVSYAHLQALVGPQVHVRPEAYCKILMRDMARRGRRSNEPRRA